MSKTTNYIQVKCENKKCGKQWEEEFEQALMENYTCPYCDGDKLKAAGEIDRVEDKEDETTEEKEKKDEQN